MQIEWTVSCLNAFTAGEEKAFAGLQRERKVQQKTQRKRKFWRR